MRRRAFVAGSLGAALAAAVSPLTAASAASASATPTLLVLVYITGGAYPPRPSGTAPGAARYIGPVLPDSWLVGDEWIKTP